MSHKDPFHRNKLIRQAMSRAIHEAMREDPTVYIIGEGAHVKQQFDAPEIAQEFHDRIVTLPISEDANGNMAVGMSIAGLKPVVDMISSDFTYRCFDSIANTMAKQATVAEPRTIVVKSEFMTGGPTSGQRIEALFAHIPGLRVGVPSDEKDAYQMMKDALTYKGVSILFEDRMIDDAELGIALPYVEHEVTMVSYGFTQQKIEAFGWISFNQRWIWPLDLSVLIEHVRSTQRLLIVEPAQTFMGIGAEIAAQVAEALPGVRIKRIGAPRCTIPASRELHEQMMPSIEQIQAAVKELEAA